VGCIAKKFLHTRQGRDIAALIYSPEVEEEKQSGGRIYNECEGSK
jgi:hypothetical protein